MVLFKRLPLVQSLQHYSKATLLADALAAMIVTIMLIPQSLAYALLAGLPPQVGLYASILPLVLYAFFGSSRTLSVGPVAIASLMTASSLASVAQQGHGDYLSAAITLALLSGVFLTAMGVFKCGFLGNFLSHSVVSGFISASAIIIALSQLKHILGIPLHGDNVHDLVGGLWQYAGDIQWVTVLLGVCILLFLWWSKKNLAKVFIAKGLSAKTASALTKTAPVIAIFASISAVYFAQLTDYSVAIVGHIPSGLPSLVMPSINVALMKALLVPAILISIIGYVESISVGKTLAAKRSEKIDVDQEFIGLGLANIGSAFSGGFPVTGGFSRSVVNFDAGAITQLASVMAAVGIAIATVVLTPALYYLPKATLAATIIVAVVALIDFSFVKKSWHYNRSDFYAVVATIIITLWLGVEMGVASGVGLSIVLILYRTSKPHIAEVGLIENTEHYRNVRRYQVITEPSILTLRVDESLYFANASYLEDTIYHHVYQRGEIAHIILMCSAINEIDLSSLEMLEAVNKQLISQGISLHLSEVKGPVLEVLQRSHFLQHLSGNIYMTQHEAFSTLSEMPSHSTFYHT